MEEISDVIVVSLMATFVSKNLLKIWFDSMSGCYSKIKIYIIIFEKMCSLCF